MTTENPPTSADSETRWHLHEVPSDNTRRNNNEDVTSHNTESSPITIGILTLNRPDKRNALTPPMLAAIPPAIDELVARGARAIVITGEGKVFCAGFDLSLCKDDNDDSKNIGSGNKNTQPVLAQLLTLLAQVTRAMRACPVPVIVAAHGGAVAGACAILCAADIAVTDQHAKIGYPVVPLGISPAVSAPHLAAQVGMGPARARLLDPSLITGTQAQKLGLAHHLVNTREDVLPLATQLAQQLAAKPPHALRETKLLLNSLENSTSSNNHTNTLDAALNASLSIVGSAEQRQLLAQIWD